jgi:hypothetical protein
MNIYFFFYEQKNHLIKKGNFLTSFKMKLFGRKREFLFFK